VYISWSAKNHGFLQTGPPLIATGCISLEIAFFFSGLITSS